MRRSTIYLARLLGSYSVLIALILLARGGRMVETAIGDPNFVLFAGIVALALGLAIVIGHNVWTGGAMPVIVTLVGWYTIAKGVMLLAVTPALLEHWLATIRFSERFPLYLLPALMIGAYLAWAGFSARLDR